MKVFFLSNQNSCRSQMAEAILRSFDKEIEIYSAGLEPVDHVSPVAIEIMAEIGINIDQHKPQSITKFENLNFDYLITVGDGTQEELNLPKNLKYKRKMHLGFRNPYKYSENEDEIKQKCREIRDEIRSEMDYFYHKIIKKEREIL